VTLVQDITPLDIPELAKLFYQVPNWSNFTFSDVTANKTLTLHLCRNKTDFVDRFKTLNEMDARLVTISHVTSEDKLNALSCNDIKSWSRCAVLGLLTNAFPEVFSDQAEKVKRKLVQRLNEMFTEDTH
jgi:hypothetical protein